MVAAVLEPLGYVFKENYGPFARYVHLGGQRPVVDIMLLNAGTFGNLLAQSQVIELSGVHLRAPKPLHLVALKLHALKQNPARLGKDWEDIKYLLGKFAWTREELSQLAARYGSGETAELLRQNDFL